MKKLLLAAAFLALSPGIARAAATNCSGTIVTNNVPITLISGPTPAPTVLLIQNIDTREAMWIAFGGVTAQPGGLGSFILPPSQSRAFATQSVLLLTFSPSSSVSQLSVVAATAGHRISCTYW